MKFQIQHVLENKRHECVPEKKMTANDSIVAEKQLPKLNPSHLSYELLMSFNAID